jgi:hypothetical protein
MLNLKKGLALVLAAATVFTFAPVANLGTPVTAEAAGNKLATDQDLITLQAGGQTATLDVPQIANDKVTYKVDYDSSYLTLYSVEVNNVTTAAATSGQPIDQKKAFRIESKDKVGTTKITLHYRTTSGERTWSINVAIEAPGDYITHQIRTPKTGFETANGSKDNPYVVNVDPDAEDTITITLPDVKGYFTNKKLTALESADKSVVEVKNYTQSDLKTEGKASLKLSYKKAGETTLKATWDRLNVSKGSHDSASSLIYFKVVEKKSVLKAGGTEVGEGILSKDTPIVETINLSADNPTADLKGTFSNPQDPDEKLTYSGVLALGTNSSDTTNVGDLDKYNSSDLKISDGKVTATAQALSGVEKYYNILIYNNLGIKKLTADKSDTARLKVGIIRVIARRDGTSFTTVTAKVGADQEVKAAAEYAADGSVKNASVTKDVQLSTADLTSVAFSYTSTNPGKTTVASNDTSIVEVKDGQLVAKKTGNATVTVKAESDTTHYGDAEIRIRVNVTDQYINNKIVAENVYLNKLTRSAKIKATVTPAANLSYRIVNQLADGSYVTGTDSNITLAADGTVTYNTTAEGKAIVEITGASTNTAKAPTPAYITVYYSNEKLASRLNVETKSLNLNVGETGTVVASGSALSYASNDTDVATVDAKTGVVTAVKAGVATITVTDAGDANYQSGSKDVTVYVYGASDNTVAKPAKVTGLKVSNKKGAYVSVKWTSQGQNINYRVYKKVGNGKWVGKNVAGNKTTLSVKKGAKVQVKVKSYVKDANGKTTWGPAATKAKTFKTDKK